VASNPKPAVPIPPADAQAENRRDMLKSSIVQGLAAAEWQMARDVARES
jgi:hypothetical protein